MSMSDCVRCWDTPCRCGHDYKHWNDKELNDFIKMLNDVRASRAQQSVTVDHSVECNGPLLYVASRASLPERPAMWRELRANGWRIASTWIDEAGAGETENFVDLWGRIETEVRESDGLILYAEREDFPLKGALVEVGMAIGMKKPVAVVLGGLLFLEPRSLRPVGSWLNHPRCCVFGSVGDARTWIEKSRILN